MDKNKSQYVVLLDFMVNDLGLTGNELLTYAIIYGFSQNGEFFSGSRRYLSRWCNCGLRSVDAYLLSLIKKGLIEKRDRYINGVKLCDYKATGVEEIKEEQG